MLTPPAIKATAPPSAITPILSPDPGIKPFYFDIFQKGPFRDMTNPFMRRLTSTSLDGGIGYLNLPPRDEPYTLTATKRGLSFSTVKIKARKGAFINLSPPQGPKVLLDYK